MSDRIILPEYYRQKSQLRAGAKFSTNRAYRYALWRPVPLTEEVSTRAFVVIGLNPSTADETIDDPTVRRCLGFALREGCGLLVMLNLFAARTPSPDELKSLVSPVGPGNDRALIHYTTKHPVVPLIVAAWGVHGTYRNRDREVQHLLRVHDVPVFCFGRTTEGHPKHPLYLAATTPLEPFNFVSA